jgi:hypothetical protein
MGEFQAATGLPAKIVAGRGIVKKWIGDKFQGDLPLKLLVLREPHHAHPALPENPR